MYQKQIHSPTLRTIKMVESILMKNSGITIPELKIKLPRKVNHNTLMEIIDYLIEKRDILLNTKGITWIGGENEKLDMAIKKGIKH